MTLPGISIQTGSLPVTRTFPTGTATWFVTGESEKGKAGTAIELLSAQDMTAKLGARVAANPLAWDALELFFALGGSKVQFSREVGPAAAQASVTLNDGSAAATMRVKAKGEGAYGNALNVQIVAGTGFVIVVTHDTDPTIAETSPDFASVSEAVSWGASVAQHVLVEDIGPSSNNPAVVAAQSLTGGTDDRLNITQTQVTNALAVFGAELGSGQVSSPGRTTSGAHAAVMAHGLAFDRVPRLDAVDTATTATVTALADTDRAVAGHKTARFAWPWVQITALTGTGQARYAAPSAALAALEAVNDDNGVSPNQPAAGEFGIVDAPLVVGLSQAPVTATVREQLADKGVTVLRAVESGQIRIYDSVTLANPLTDPDYKRAGLGRLVMRIRAEVKPVLERYMFREITDENRLNLEGEIASVIDKYRPGSIPDYVVAAQSLAACRAAEAFLVNASVQVSPDGRRVQMTFTAKTTEA